MQNFIGIAGGDDLSRDRFIEKFRWRSILFSFFLFFFFWSDVTANYHRTNVFIFTAITERII